MFVAKNIVNLCFKMSFLCIYFSKQPRKGDLNATGVYIKWVKIYSQPKITI
jgi:hypothetical protein